MLSDLQPEIRGHLVRLAPGLDEVEPCGYGEPAFPDVWLAAIEERCVGPLCIELVEIIWLKKAVIDEYRHTKELIEGDELELT